MTRAQTDRAVELAHNKHPWELITIQTGPAAAFHNATPGRNGIKTVQAANRAVTAAHLTVAPPNLIPDRNAVPAATAANNASVLKPATGVETTATVKTSHIAALTKGCLRSSNPSGYMSYTDLDRGPGTPVPHAGQPCIRKGFSRLL